MRRGRKRACAQTSRVSLIRECRDMSGSRLCFFAYRSTQGLHVADCFHFCKDFTLCSITKDRIQSFFFLNKNKSSLIQPVLHYTDTLPSCDFELVHHIQFWWGLFRRLNYINCIHCAIEHLGGEQLPIVGYRSHMALSVKSITVVVVVSIHSLY